MIDEEGDKFFGLRGADANFCKARECKNRMKNFLPDFVMYLAVCAYVW